MGRRRSAEELISPSPYYPPADVLTQEARYNLERQRQYIETPVDKRGLIDVGKLLSLILQTADPEYTWECVVDGERKKPNIHHLYYTNSTKADYPKQPNSIVNPYEFRQGKARQIRLPMQTHNHWHRVAIPAPIPPRDTMYHCIDAQRNADAMFEAASESRRLFLQREEGLDDQTVRQGLTENFETFLQELEYSKTVPEEFRIVNLGDFEPRCVPDIIRVSDYLGKICTIATVTRDIRAIAQAGETTKAA